MFHILFTILLITIFTIPFAFSKSSETSGLSQKIIQLRNEVSELSNDFKTEKELIKSKIQTYALEKLDLESQIRRKKIQLKTIDEKIKTAKSIENIENADLTQLIAHFFEFESSRLLQSLPYKIQERTDYIQQLKEKFLDQKNSDEKTLQLLWTHIEDEIQLSKDVSLDKDILKINGKSTIVEIAKVGMLMMFFKTSEGKTGFLNFSNNQWSPRFFEIKSNTQLVQLFFENLKKQIRTGYFEFPQIPLKTQYNIDTQNAKSEEKNENA